MLSEMTVTTLLLLQPEMYQTKGQLRWSGMGRTSRGCMCRDKVGKGTAEEASMGRDVQIATGHSVEVSVDL